MLIEWSAHELTAFRYTPNLVRIACPVLQQRVCRSSRRSCSSSQSRASRPQVRSGCASPIKSPWVSWLPIHHRRALFALVVDDGTTDEVWWEEGAPVQSLQIECIDDMGYLLDPWQLSELLMDCGAMSVSVDDAAKGTDAEVPLFHDHDSPQAFDRSFALASATGRKDLWGGSSRVVALFPSKWNLVEVVTTVEERNSGHSARDEVYIFTWVTSNLFSYLTPEVLELASPLSFKVDDVVDKDWIKTVQESWEPIETGRLRIRFPWHDPLPPSKLRPDQVELVLEGGRAFGTGEHPTTSMCCAFLEEFAEGHRVLDYGSGSGILGLAALRFGATEAIGVELDLEAIASAAVNAAKNDLLMDTYYPQEIGRGDDMKLVLTKLSTSQIKGEALALERPDSGTMELLPAADGEAISATDLGTFDVTVANILAGTIVRLQPVFAHFTRPGGKLALTGILAEQADTVLEAFGDTFNVAVTETIDGWVLITGSRLQD